jgi:septation ring formation regulator EzrA
MGEYYHEEVERGVSELKDEVHELFNVLSEELKALKEPQQEIQVLIKHVDHAPSETEVKNCA